MSKVYISIGSNLNAEENIALAKFELKKLFNCSFSDTFNSKAIGFSGNDFLNLVAGFTYESNPYVLKKILKDIEIKMGRDSDQKGMSDRVIDLDLILFGKLIIQNEVLSLPSKDIEKHLFVLEPLSQIAGNEIHPLLNISFKEMLTKIRSK